MPHSSSLVLGQIICSAFCLDLSSVGGNGILKTLTERWPGMYKVFLTSDDLTQHVHYGNLFMSLLRCLSAFISKSATSVTIQINNGQ